MSPLVHRKIRRLLLAILPVVLALIAIALIMPGLAAEARVTQTSSIQLSPHFRHLLKEPTYPVLRVC